MAVVVVVAEVVSVCSPPASASRASARRRTGALAAASEETRFKKRKRSAVRTHAYAPDAHGRVVTALHTVQKKHTMKNKHNKTFKLNCIVQWVRSRQLAEGTRRTITSLSYVDSSLARMKHRGFRSLDSRLLPSATTHPAPTLLSFSPPFCRRSSLSPAA